MQNKLSNRPSAVATGGIVHYSQPASPGVDSRGKPFIIKLVKCSQAPNPINVPSRNSVFAA